MWRQLRVNASQWCHVFDTQCEVVILFLSGRHSPRQYARSRRCSRKHKDLCFSRHSGIRNAWRCASLCKPPFSCSFGTFRLLWRELKRNMSDLIRENVSLRLFALPLHSRLTRVPIRNEWASCGSQEILSPRQTHSVLYGWSSEIQAQLYYLILSMTSENKLMNQNSGH